MRVCAVASGTSADGLEVAVVDLGLEDSNVSMETVLWRTHPWSDGLHEQVLALAPPATTSAAALCFLDQRVGQAVADAVETTIAMLDRPPHLVVSPGQTVFHDVRDGLCLGTLQIGQPAWVAERTGLPVVSDLRARDVAAGGQGSALTSTLDALWLAAPGGPRAGLDLGEIATVTLVGDEGDAVQSWDTGPGTCLIDAATARVAEGGQSHDDGGLAAGGTVVTTLLDLLLEHPHFTLVPPVSTGREAFSAGYLDDVLERHGDVSRPDLLATLTELTAYSVARALRPHAVTGVVVSGGGVHDRALMGALRRHLDGVHVVVSDELGIPADAKEAVMWALLGFLTWHGVPGTLLATGVEAPRVLGRITPGAEPLRLPPPANAFHKQPRRLRVLVPGGAA